MTGFENAIRAARSQWTSDPVDQPRLDRANPASGHCASTALVVQDRLGGELLMADVHEADGSRQGVHYWNRLPDGRELDLTREQFRRGEVVASRAWSSGHPTSGAGAWPVTTTCWPLGSCASGTRRRYRQGRVPRPRRTRPAVPQPPRRVELPGGRPEVGEQFQDCVRRELPEETGLEVGVDGRPGRRGRCEVLPGAWVDVVAYGRRRSRRRLRPSAEHTSVAFVEPAEAELPAAYSELVDAHVLWERHVGG